MFAYNNNPSMNKVVLSSPPNLRRNLLSLPSSPHFLQHRSIDHHLSYRRPPLQTLHQPSLDRKSFRSFCILTDKSKKKESQLSKTASPSALFVGHSLSSFLGGTKNRLSSGKQSFLFNFTKTKHWNRRKRFLTQNCIELPPEPKDERPSIVGTHRYSSRVGARNPQNMEKKGRHGEKDKLTPWNVEQKIELEDVCF